MGDGNVTTIGAMLVFVLGVLDASFNSAFVPMIVMLVM